MFNRCVRVVPLAAAFGLSAMAYAGGWVEFTDETSSRLVSDAALGVSDTQEKDYHWGDLDQDGDMDLVVVRKEPFTSAGGRANVLFMNEGVAEGHAIDGVFVDRTAEYAIASQDGSEGFNDPTNDRDVWVVDVDDDTWLDIVTATTISDGLPKTISHPRIYRNLGEIDGVWQGFLYEESRIPQIYTIGAGDAVAPRFCSVTAGDVTGDDMPDLYFGDYDSSGAGGVPPPPGVDVNDRLFVNDGTGHFTDSLETRMSEEMLVSAFGTSVTIADMNDDGVNDIVKDTGLQTPTRISVAYNNPSNEGTFSGFDVVYDRAPYFVTLGDLNNDGRLDMVAVDDGTDRYLLNQGNGVDGYADFLELTLPTGPSSGFGGNALIRDLNNDGFNDVIITDVDVDIAGCDRRMHIYRNLGNIPNVSFQEQGEVIPNSEVNGTHDVAIIDINNDGWLDMVVGRCSGTSIWMNVPPVGVVFVYPEGVPAFLTPGETTDFLVEPMPIGDVELEPGTGVLHYAINDDAFVQAPMADAGKGRYLATLPAVACTDRINYFVSAEITGGTSFTDPPGAPADTFGALAAEGTEITLRDEIEGDVSGWTIEDIALTSGTWEQADPTGTIAGTGQQAAPEDDATNGAENVQAFVTSNGIPGAGAGTNDVDGGPTRLISAAIDLAGSDATISYARWFFCDDEDTADADFFTVDVSNDDGATWVPILEHTTGSTSSAWETVAFLVGDYVEPTDQVRVRFSATDQPNNSVTEAGVDNFQVEVVLCGEGCGLDLDNTGAVDFGDLLAVLSSWGPCDGCPADFDGSLVVDFLDLLEVLSNWGPCP